MSDINATIVRRFVDEIINNGNYAVLRELIHPDYVYRSPDQELYGPAALEDLFTAYRTGIPDLAATIDELIVSGDSVVISITLSGTHTGNLMGIPATGNPLSVHGMVRSRLQEGKIIEEWEILDMLGMFQQLGVISFPSQAAA
jgi:steroid delta-isomerase-like uncharacterized protein